MNIDSAGAQMQTAALHNFSQTAEQQEQAESEVLQHLHHYDYLAGKQTQDLMIKFLQRNRLYSIL